MGQNNFYVVADGLGGTGKDTVLADLERRFLGLGYRVVKTFEPGGTTEANRLRSELFSRKAAGEITPEEELEYVFTARRLNMEGVVLPALLASEPTIVLKARDYMSSFIYQIASGASRDLLLEFYRKRHEIEGFPKPDIRLMLLLDPETAMRRRMGVGAGGDGFDLQPDEYWKRVAIGYYNEAVDISNGRGLFRRETAIVDASQTISRVCDESWRLVSRRLGLPLEEGNETRLTHSRRRGVERGRIRGWTK